MINELVVAERLRELLAYDPETGVFTRRVRSAPRVRVGTVAGGVNKISGYRHIRVDGRTYMAHRLAWLYMTGGWPKDQIDHVNGATTDNRWCNLRPADNSRNRANSVVQSNSNSGLKGVFKSGRKWRAYTTAGGKLCYLGRFNDQEEAALAAATAAYAVFGAFARPHWRDVLADIGSSHE
jgi:HNH endonuclease